MPNSPEVIGQALAEAEALLGEAGVIEARADCRLLLSAVTGIDPRSMPLRLADALPPGQARRFLRLVRRRARREPVSRILGERWFWALPFRVTPAVLDPRPDSEVLVEQALALLRQRADGRAPRVLDLGTGSGCLLLAVLAELPEATGVGLDASEAALAVAMENAARLGLDDRASFRLGGWDAAIGERYDAILCNPPYIESGMIAALDPEVRDHDPFAALDGGIDGLDAFRDVMGLLPELLEPGAPCLFEIGSGQEEAVGSIAVITGLHVAGTTHDLAGRPRCITVRHIGVKAQKTVGSVFEP